MTSSAARRPAVRARAPRRPPLRALTPLGLALCTLTLISCMSAPGHSAAARRSDGQPSDAAQSSATGHSTLGAAASGSAASGGATASPDALPALTPAQKAGQRVIYSYTGLEPPAALLSWIRHGQVGGVIFFGGNISSKAQIASVITKLKQANASSLNPMRAVPLLLMTDQEGGLVRRLPGQPLLSQKQIGQSAHPAAAAKAAGTGAGRATLLTSSAARTAATPRWCRPSARTSSRLSRRPASRLPPSTSRASAPRPRRRTPTR